MFIGAGTIVLPGVEIGNRVVIGAGSVITKSIPENSVVVGNPAKAICTYDEYMEKQQNAMKNAEKFRFRPDKNEQKKIKLFLAKNRIGYIE